MPRVFGNLFQAQMAIMGRVQRFLSSVEQRLSKDGRFFLGSGQPLQPSYRYYDPETNENVWLWRTVQDEAAQALYRKYRQVVELGMHAALRDIDPELFNTVRKDKREQRVRAYDLCSLLSNAYTNIVCGGGVTIDTGNDQFNQALKEIKLEQKFPQWVWEASVFRYVGVQVSFDQDSEAFDIARIWPDHLYIVKDQINTDEIEYIAKRIWMPMQHVKNWVPLTLEVKCLDGVKVQPANGVQMESRSGANGGSTANSIIQDGFVYEERHYRGWVEYSFYATTGSRIIQEVPLSLYDAELAKSPVCFTGMRDFAITIIPNVTTSGHWRSDWEGVFDAVVDFNIRATKNSRLVDKYSAPTPIVPSTHIQVDPYTGQARWGHSPDEVIVARPTDKILPSFLQPNANFDAPKQDLDFSLSMIGLLAQARYAVDPEVIEQIDSGVALKLKMSPTIAFVAPRKEAVTDALRTIVFNLMSAIEYYTSDNVDPANDNEEQNPAGVVFSGPLYEHVLKLKKDKLMQMKRGKRISLEDMQPIFASITLADDGAASTNAPKPGAPNPQDPNATGAGKPPMPPGAKTPPGATGKPGEPGDEPPQDGEQDPQDETQEDPQAEGQEPQEDGDEGAPAEKKKKVTGVLPWGRDWGDPEKEGDGFKQKKQTIGGNSVDSVGPAMLKLDDLQRQLDALHVMDVVISEQSIKVRLASGLPQDHAEAATRCSGGTMSLFRLLTEFDGMTEDEANEEILRINDQEAAKAPPPGFGGSPTDVFSMDDPEKLKDQEDRQRTKEDPPVPGVNDRNDQIGPSTQFTSKDKG